MIFISEYFIIRGPFICGFEWKEKCQGSGRKKKIKIKNEKNEKQQKNGKKNIKKQNEKK